MRTAATATLGAVTALVALTTFARATVDTAELEATLAKVRGFEQKLDATLAEKKAALEAALFKAGPCEPGYYQETPKDPCTVCGEDAVCPGGKLGKRAPCPVGYSTAGLTTASSADTQCFKACEPGTYASISTGPSAACYSCGAGFFCPGGPQSGPLEDRVSCQLGYSTVVNDATGVEDCVIECKPGYYSQFLNGPCEPCGLDYYCAGGPQGPIPLRVKCPLLTPITNTTTGDDPGACVQCAAGTSFFNGTCIVECAVGYYANNTMATSCEACEIGFYCPGGTQASGANRTACDLGYTTLQPATGTESGCVPVCGAGYYSNGMLPCSECGPNAYCPGGPQPTGLQEECPDNTFTSSNTSSTAGQCQTCAVGTPPTCTVTTCAAGYFAPSPSAPCEVCAAGFTCPGGAQTTPLRTPCTDGLTTLTTTASAPGECVRVCDPGYFAASPTAPCQPCLSPYYCEGGSQAEGPVRDPCPQSPYPYVTLTSTATKKEDCVISCPAGLYSPLPAGPTCVDCGIGDWCLGGPQATIGGLRTPCKTGLTTLTTTATRAEDCIAYECPPGLLPTTVQPPMTEADCGVLTCDPCGDPTPDLYMTGKLGVYVTEDWTNTTAPGSATLVCSFDKYDPTLCAQTSTSARDTCTTNDIAIDAAGNYYVLGRTGGTYGTSGWVIKIDPDAQQPGEPCVYTVLLSGIEPFAGLGAAPKSNLLYATGSNSVLTLQINTDGSLTTAGQLSVPGFTGAGDITAGLNGEVYVISGDGKSAYEVNVDTNYRPTSVSSAIATTGSTYPAAFCTPDGPLAVASFATFGNVATFVNTANDDFVKVGVSGQVQASGLSGAAVAPVCSVI